MQLGTPERHSLLETQQQVDTIEGKVETIEGKVETIEGKVDNLSVQLRTMEAGINKLLAADEERQKEKEMKENAEQKDKENAEVNLDEAMLTDLAKQGAAPVVVPKKAGRKANPAALAQDHLHVAGVLATGLGVVLGSPHGPAHAVPALLEAALLGRGEGDLLLLEGLAGLHGRLHRL